MTVSTKRPASFIKRSAKRTKINIAMDWPKNARPETKMHVSFTKRNAARMTVSIAMDWPRNVRPETKMPVSFTKRNVKRTKISIATHYSKNVRLETRMPVSFTKRNVERMTIILRWTGKEVQGRRQRCMLALRKEMPKGYDSSLDEICANVLNNMIKQRKRALQCRKEYIILRLIHTLIVCPLAQ